MDGEAGLARETSPPTNCSHTFELGKVFPHDSGVFKDPPPIENKFGGETPLK
jgi:hypothetical protein